MDTIKVEKADLIKVLGKNRDTHRAKFERAYANFREEAIDELEKRLDQARDGGPVDVRIGMVRPEDHTEDYDRAIGMLEMDTRKRVSLTRRDYQTYVQDDWGWKAEVTATNRLYGVE